MTDTFHNFNLNDYIRVKFTDDTLEYLQEQHDKRYAHLGKEYAKKLGPIIPEPDEDGWRKYQLWHFCNTFGPTMQLGRQNVVETAIQFQIKED